MYPPSSNMRVVLCVTTMFSSVNEDAALITTVPPSLYIVMSDNSEEMKRR